jgi:hypothetical protein
MQSLIELAQTASVRDVDSACCYESWNCQRFVHEQATLVLMFAVADAIVWRRR